MKETITLIQLPLLKNQMEVDIIEQKYWETLNKSVLKIFSEMDLDKQLMKSRENFSGFHEPNIGLLYIASILRENGYEVKYLDFHLLDANYRISRKRPISMEDIEEEIARIDQKDLKLVGISPLTVSYSWSEKIAKIIKKRNNDAKIILGGVHVSFMYKEILETNNDIDFISVGESELTIVELLDALIRNDFKPSRDYSLIKGIAFRSNNEVVFTGKRTLNASLDNLPYPAYDLLPPVYLKNAILRVLTSRGCVNNCIFCVPSKIFNKVSFRSPKNVVDEIEFHNKNYQCNTFMIGDLNFINNYDFAIEFCNALIERNLNIYWMCQSRTDLIDENIAKLMKKAGCVMVCLGVESADELVLKKNNKNITSTNSINACKVVKDVGLRVFTYWALGLPGETHESAQATINLLTSLLEKKLLDYTHITMVVPYPGTPLYKNPEKYDLNIVSYNFNDYWLGCDYLGAGLPVARTKELSEWEIYAYWQLAMSIVIDKLL